MLKYSVIFFIISYLLVPYKLIAFDSNRVKKLSITDAVEKAVENNRSIILSTLSRDSTKQNLIVAKDRYNIQSKIIISSDYYRTYSRHSDSSYEKNYSGKFQLSKLFNSGGSVQASYNLLRFDRGADSGYNSDTTVSFSQPLLKGFGRRVATASLESSKISDNMSIRSYEDSVSSVIKSTINAYRNLVLTKKQYDIVGKSIQLSKQLIKINKELVKAGRLANMDLVEMKADLLYNEMQLLSAKNLLETAQINLVKLLGMKTDLSLDVIPEKLKIINISKKDVIKKTFANRKDYLNAVDNLRLAELSLDVAKNNMLWDLSFTTSISSTGNDESRIIKAFSEPFSGEDWDFRAGLVLNIPLTRVTLKAGLVQAKNSLESSKVALAQLKDSIMSEIRNLLFQIDTAKLQIERSKALYEVSKKKVNAEIEKYKAGKTTNFQLLSYKNQLVQSEIDLLSSKINYMNLITELEFTEGILYQKWKFLIPKKIKSLMEYQ